MSRVTDDRRLPPALDVLDDALARWDSSTDIDSEVTRAQTRRAAEYLATTGDRLRRADLVETTLNEVAEILCK